jgi:uncharacterized repeat protein (TIGR01451 family)
MGRRSASRALRLGLLVPALALCAMAGATSSASAASFTVNDTNDAALASPLGETCSSSDNGGCTLRAAVQAADNVGGSNTITLPAGDYKLTIPTTASNPNQPAVGDLDVNNGDALTIVGAGAGSTTIDANHVDRAFAVDAPGDSLTLSGVTITGGEADTSSPSSNANSTDPGFGGAIYNDGALAVTDSMLENDKSNNDGGGIYSDSGATSTSIVDSTISHDVTANYSGGGVDIEAGSLTLSGSSLDYDTAVEDDSGALNFDSSGVGTISTSSFQHDSGDDSGAIGDSGTGTLNITTSTISNDSAEGASSADGGGITTSNGALTLTSSTLDNDGAGYGGALYLGSSGPATISGDTFVNDAAGYYYGGAVYDDNTGAIEVNADTFTGNSGYYGGAFYYSGQAGQLTNDTFDGNTGYYGALYLDTTGEAVLTNLTIAHNSGSDGAGLAYPSDAASIVNTIVADNEGGDCYSGPAGTTVDQGHNIDSDGTCFATGGVGNTPEVASDQVGVNPGLGPLADNGGLTETDALLVGSPAIGEALDSACPTTDERGVARPAACDIGAFQTAPADLSIGASAPASVLAGLPMTETLTVANNGPGPANSVVVSDPMPAGVIYLGASASQGSCTGGSTVTCDIGTLDSSATGSTTSATVTIMLIPTELGPLTDTGTVTASESDPNVANNTASATTQVIAAVGQLQSLTLNAHHKRNMFRFSGRLTLPSGMSATSSCKGAVTIRVMHERRTLTIRKTRLTDGCTYSRSIEVGGSSQRRITATFEGNALLSHSSDTIHIRSH